MKALFTLFIIFFTLVSSYAQVFVKFDANGANNGSSWMDAFTNLQNAIDNTPENGQIWVASGTYHPNIINSPSDSNFLLITKPLKLYGGFVGSEISLDQRDWESNPSLLSGDINNDDIENDFFSNKFDNTMHVLFITGDNVIIDGFNISYGKTRFDFNIDAPSFYPWRAGGIYCQSSLVIRNCNISQNIAYHGGGLYVSYQENINLDNCTFVDNYAVSYGGGIVVGNSNALINNCTFENNISESSVGGGIFLWQNENAASDSNVISIKNTVFDSNQSILGGGLALNNFNLGSQLKIDSCFFFSNRAILSGDGGGLNVYNSASSSIKHTIKLNISNTVFDGNSADRYGGAIVNENRGDAIEVSIQNCNFNENITVAGGSGIFNLNRTFQGDIKYLIEGCNFIGNITNGWAGAIYNTPYAENHPGPNGIIKECTFKDNYASDCCGAILSGYGHCLIENCLFENNGTSGDNPYINGGGAISFVVNKSTELRNSIFKGNYSGTEGSAILFDDNYDSARLENLLIYDHEGESTIFINSPMKLALINTSIVDNETGIVAESSPTIELQNNIFMNDVNLESIGDVEIKSNGGNISSDNSFVDYFITDSTFPDRNETDPLLDENYVPLSESPAIDAGNPDGILSTIDAAGNPRIQGFGIDAGALESSIVSAIENADWDSNILNIFPNPVESILNIILIDIPLSKIQVQIYTQTGNLLLMKDYHRLNSTNHIKYNVQDLASGPYLLIVSMNGKKYGQILIKQ